MKRIKKSSAALKKKAAEMTVNINKHASAKPKYQRSYLFLMFLLSSFCYLTSIFNQLYGQTGPCRSNIEQPSAVIKTVKIAPGIPFTLKQVVERIKSENLSVAASNQRVRASTLMTAATKDNGLPDLKIGASYQRFSKLTLYEDGLTQAHNVDRRPDQNSFSLGTEASFTLYNGGKQHLAVHSSILNHDLALINTQELTGDITLQTIFHYLDMVRLISLDSLLGEEVKRAEIRLNNIQALFDNQVVTKSDLLRAEVGLSAGKLAKMQARNDLIIANQQLDILIGLPDSIIIIPTGNIQQVALNAENLIDTSSLPALVNNAYRIRRFKKSMELKQTQLKFVKSNYLPSMQLYSAYGLQYPNQLFFPPVARWYSVGFVGIRAQFNLSSLYKNKHKVAAEKIELNALQLNESMVQLQLEAKLKAFKIKYEQTSERISVAKQNIHQSRVNLNIVSLKYFNQLALLTDLLDADNLYMASTYSLVKAQMDRQLLYYKMLYTTGQL